MSLRTMCPAGLVLPEISVSPSGDAARGELVRCTRGEYI